MFCLQTIKSLWYSQPSPEPLFFHMMLKNVYRGKSVRWKKAAVATIEYFIKWGGEKGRGAKGGGGLGGGRGGVKVTERSF